MAGSISKSISRAKKSLDKAVAQRKRKRAFERAKPALKTAGTAATIIAVVAGAAYATRAALHNRSDARKLASRKKKVVAAAATAVGASAIAARVSRGKAGK